MHDDEIINQHNVYKRVIKISSKLHLNLAAAPKHRSISGIVAPETNFVREITKSPSENLQRVFISAVKPL